MKNHPHYRISLKVIIYIAQVLHLSRMIRILPHSAQKYSDARNLRLCTWRCFQCWKTASLEMQGRVFNCFFHIVFTILICQKTVLENDISSVFTTLEIRNGFWFFKKFGMKILTTITIFKIMFLYENGPGMFKLSTHSFRDFQTVNFVFF